MRCEALGPLLFEVVDSRVFACSGDQLGHGVLYTLDCHLNNDGRVWKPDGHGRTGP
jgi:hypothetical protein